MNEKFLKIMARGVEAKLLQYEEYAKVKCETKINLKSNLNDLFKKDLDVSCIMINLEQHKERYQTTVQELEKVSCKNLIHFKATYWKNRPQFEQDLTTVMQFLSQFHPEIDATKEYKFDKFSETHDKNIWIQDGPLACYCSHLRAMIYGYLNFEDYTLIIEDDISIVNTEKIGKYLSQIPDDWDVICIGSIPKNQILSEEDTFYKFATDFHSTHFYIIRNSSFPKIFKGLYPITDQVDVLISNMKHELNIYNIPQTVYQKNIGTHTQNNLHVIFNSPNYDILREALATIKKHLSFFCNLLLPNNAKRNEIIVENLMYDVLYEYILKSGMDGTEGLHQETFHVDCSAHVEKTEYEELMEGLYFFVRCCKKGIDPKHIAKSLLNNLLFTIQKFKLHNTIKSGRILKAYGFGSTAHIYEANGIIIKVYNDKMRWMTIGYDDPKKILFKESRILETVQRCKHVPKILSVHGNIIEMSYGGESLYDDFNLPEDWKDQIREAFEEFDREGVYYPEFRLQNILVNFGKITFVDFGMAELSGKSNSENCERFLSLLNILHEKFKTVPELDRRHALINTFFRNLNLEENAQTNAC
jgi:predicted Ser/Thr protein kinase